MNFWQFDIQNGIEVLIVGEKGGIWIGEIILFCVKLYTKFKKKGFHTIGLEIGGGPH